MWPKELIFPADVRGIFFQGAKDRSCNKGSLVNATLLSECHEFSAMRARQEGHINKHAPFSLHFFVSPPLFKVVNSRIPGAFPLVIFIYTCLSTSKGLVFTGGVLWAWTAPPRIIWCINLEALNLTIQGLDPAWSLGEGGNKFPVDLAANWVAMRYRLIHRPSTSQLPATAARPQSAQQAGVVADKLRQELRTANHLLFAKLRALWFGPSLKIKWNGLWANKITLTRGLVYALQSSAATKFARNYFFSFHNK